ncbi:ATP-binding domain-containing protein [Vibrio lentus]|nr:ATP-binding domain-containing protein [Vibrio lentus]
MDVFRAEERRLFYVAMTRAKEKVWITHIVVMVRASYKNCMVLITLLFVKSDIN